VCPLVTTMNQCPAGLGHGHACHSLATFMCGPGEFIYSLSVDEA
jgi:hypothetical protein